MTPSVRHVAQHYVERVDRIEIVAGGLINDTYRVEGDTDACILQRLAPDVFGDGADVMANIVAFTDHLGAPGRRG